jgi:hypothetical protein
MRYRLFRRLATRRHLLDHPYHTLLLAARCVLFWGVDWDNDVLRLPAVCHQGASSLGGKTLLVLLFIGMATGPAISQEPSFDPIWMNSYLNTATDAAQSVALIGDTIVLSGSHVTPESSAPMIMLLDSSGGPFDTIMAEFPVGQFFALCSVPTGRRSFLVCGTTSQSDTVVGFACEVQLDGRVTWFSLIRSAGAYQQSLNAAACVGGEYVFVGEALYEIGSSIDGRYWAVWVDTAGVVLQNRTYDFYPGLDDLSATCLVPVDTTDIIVSGQSPLLDRPIVTRINRDGEVVWSRRIGEIGQLIRIYSACSMDGGGVVLAGDLGFLQRDFYVTKYTTSGDRIWSNVMTLDGDQHSDRVRTEVNGTVLVVGSSSQEGTVDQVAILTVSPSGTFREQLTPSIGDYWSLGMDILPLADSTYLVAGSGVPYHGSGFYHLGFLCAHFGPDRFRPVPPNPANLLSPPDGAVIDGDSIFFSWVAAFDSNRFDTVSYRLELWNEAGQLSVTTHEDTSYTLGSDQLRAIGSGPYSWCVYGSSHLPEAEIHSAATYMFQLANRAGRSVRYDHPSAIRCRVSPSPLSTDGLLSVSIESRSDISVNLYNALGQFIRTSFSGTLNPGTHSLPINVHDLAAGPCFVRLLTPSDQIVLRLLIVR